MTDNPNVVIVKKNKVKINSDIAIEHIRLTKAFRSGNTDKFLSELKKVIVEKGKEEAVLEALSECEANPALNLLGSKNTVFTEGVIKTILSAAEILYYSEETEDFHLFGITDAPKLEGLYDMPFSAKLFKFDTGVFYSLKQDYKFSTVKTEIQKVYNKISPLVVGQDEALRQIITNYFVCKTAIDVNKKATLEVKKPTFLLQGSSGSGKTYMLEQLAIALDVPFVSFDASSITSAGYVGADVDDIVEAIVYENADRGITDSLKGIVLLDEIDKLSTSGAGEQGSKGGINTVGAQRNLLKLLEGKTMRMDSKGNKAAFDGETIDMSEVIFVFAGAFSNYVQDKKAKGTKSNVGFGKKLKESEEFTLDEQDLIDAGLMPELVGRIGRVIRINDLNRSDLKKILHDSKNSYLNQYKKIADEMGIKLSLTGEEVEEILTEAEKLKLGARGVKTVADKKFINKIGKDLFN